LMGAVIHRHGGLQPVGAKGAVDDVEVGHQGVAGAGVEPSRLMGLRQMGPLS
jgi:hypothetical protein